MRILLLAPLYSLLTLTSLLPSVTAWILGSPGHPSYRACMNTKHRFRPNIMTTVAASSKNDEYDDGLNFDLGKAGSSRNGSNSNNNNNNNLGSGSSSGDMTSSSTPKLGIDLGSMLEPLSEREAAELKAAAAEIINDAIAEGLDEIDKLRARMNREFEKKRQSMMARSEMNLNRETERLMSKIDALTDAFLAETEWSRKSTQLAAAADQAMEGRGLDFGAWGTIGGAVVGMDVSSTLSSSSLLGSVGQAQQKQQQAATAAAGGQQQPPPPQQRILILADPSQDAYAKKLVPALTEELQTILPGLAVDVFKPTATLPMGGDNAACVILFCTSFTDKSSVYKACDRLLRKTLQAGGTVGQPPSQIVAITSLGTERTNKMPYSLQNLMGGKLDQRRQIEEAVINIVRNRAVEPAMDYTICKLGELKDTVSESFDLAPGDVLDGNIALNTAVTILSQAIAFQPAARNATLSCIGQLPADTSDNIGLLLDDSFLRLDGPELYRTVLTKTKADVNYESLVEFLREWADLLAATGKGLTTPVRANIPERKRKAPPGVLRADGVVQLLFLPTATGKNYVSKEDEKVREGDRSGSAAAPTSSRRKQAKEGGIEIVVEITKPGELRVRAKRCNYAPDAVIKELSESTILSRLKDGISVWVRDHQS